jgi:alginate O-acetyltransferase complex protein AlgF
MTGAVRLFYHIQILGKQVSHLPRRTGLFGWRFQLAATALCWVFAHQADAQDVGKLYAARPPAGDAFVRVAIAHGVKGVAKIHLDLTEVHIDPTATASRYWALRAGKPVSISIDGSTVEGQIIPLADQFSTIVVERDGSGWKSYVIEEGRANLNDLKAQLRLFNFASGCQASLRVADGPVIFDVAAVRNFRSRTINPVQAQLDALCGGENASFALPQLRAGDHFSLFLTGKAGGQLNLSGQFDETEPYSDR